MFNTFAKFLLISTSLSPMLLILAISEFEKTGSWLMASVLVALTALICMLCRGMLALARHAQTHRLEVQSIERRDQETLTFLFIYLLPFIRGSSVALESPLTLVAVTAVVLTALVAARAFHFNPTMWLFGYRFYSAEDNHKQPLTLICNRRLRINAVVHANQIANGVYLVLERDRV